jgi:hypothetical protein
MFSVDNFYEFFTSHYGWEKMKMSPYTFRVHGSKNLFDLHPLVEKKLFTELPDMEFEINNSLMLHDQEPFLRFDSIYTYRNVFRDIKKDPLFLDLTDQELFLQKWRSCSWPIFCHSEKNSKDIDWIEQIGLIPCYYFWHALIARDWFRHWKHHGNIHAKSSWKQRFLLYIRDCSGTRMYRSQVKNMLYDINEHIDTDWNHDRNITADFSAKISVEDAQNTSIHIVAETVFSDSKIHVTEKTFKPMVMKQPFIVLAGPGTLQYLKNYGFRTFDCVWDETYDLEQDHDTRLIKIINIIKDLSNKSDKEFKEIIDKCWDIVDYNHKYFYSDIFEDVLLNELHTNMRTCIQEQQRKTRIDPGGSFFYAYDSMLKRNISIPLSIQTNMKAVIDAMRNRYPDRYHLVKGKYYWVD